MIFYVAQETVSEIAEHLRAQQQAADGSEKLCAPNRVIDSHVQFVT